MPDHLSPRRALGGLFTRKEKWVLAWWAKLLLLCLLIGGAVFAFRHAHAFLAVNAPVNNGILVVEGWLPRYELTNFIVRHTNYAMIYTTGGPVHPTVSRNVSDTHASVCYWVLRREAGVPAEKIQMVPSPVTRLDRTYGSAVALREWARTNRVDLHAFDVVSIGSHARRSRLLAQKAFGKETKVGVICIEPEGYDADHWWRYSEGLKEMVSESAAYLYARFFFSARE